MMNIAKRCLTSASLISKHLEQYLDILKYEIHDTDTVCAFTGLTILRGVLKKKLLSTRFTDYDYIKHDSDYVSLEVALCMSEIIPSSKEGKFNSLRNYSYFASKDELKFLNKKDAFDLILAKDLKTPFVLTFSYSNKKHTAYAARLNYSSNNKFVTTDRGIVCLNDSAISEFLPIMQSWYTILPEKKGAKQEFTFFTKKEILHRSAHNQRIERYGVEKYFNENQILDKYRDTQQFKLLTECIYAQG